MPKMPNGEPCKQILSSAALEIFKSRCTAEAFPCVRLGLSASDFQNCPDKKSSIARFFSATTEKGEASKKENANLGDSKDEEAKQRAGLADIKSKAGLMEGTKDEIEHEDMMQKDLSMFSEVDIEQQRMLLKEASMLHRLHKRTKETLEVEKSNGSIKKKKQSRNTIAQYFPPSL